MRRPSVNGPVTYTDPRPGLHVRPAGVLVGYEAGGRVALVRPRYPVGAAAIPVPARSVRPLAVVERQRQAIATIQAARKVAAPAPARVLIARLDGRPRPVPAPLSRIEDPAYLAWVRSLPCCGCGRVRSQSHHDGPRGVSQKCHDWLTAPLCFGCHRQFHQLRTLPCESQPMLAKVLILRVELTLLLEHFAGTLGRAAPRYNARGVASATLPPEERGPYLRAVLDDLVIELAQRTGRAG